MSDPFNILVFEHRPMVVTYLRAIVQDDHLAEDLTQETFLAARQSLEKFKEGSDFGRWLRGIARNKALIHWRNSRQEPIMSNSDVIDGIEDIFSTMNRNQEDSNWWEQRLNALNDCINRLSKNLRHPIQLFYFDDKSIERIAQMLNAKRDAIAQRLSRARKQIHTCMTQKIQSSSTDA